MIRKKNSLVNIKILCYHVPMDVMLIGKSSLKIKGKHASIIVDPAVKMTKTAGDAVLILEKAGTDSERVLDARIVISDPGEYEAGGIKITAVRGGKGMVYNLNVDNVAVLLANVDSLGSVADGVDGSQVTILKIDTEVESSFATAVEANALILYGEKAGEAIKLLGKEPVSTSKFSISSDKTTEEMQLVWLK